MNQRQLNKAQTSENILKVSKELFSQKGFLNTSTLEIARACGIAHGTLFLHFKDKNTLIETIFEQELKRTAEDIYRLAIETAHVEVLLDKYFLYLEQEEAFLSVIARELPFYSLELRRNILSNECILRHLFYSTIENGIKEGRFKPLDITSAVIFLFATVNYYLANKSSFVSEGSVIQSKKETLKKTFLQLLS